jgi:putative ABC transport system ATP-binding protein
MTTRNALVSVENATRRFPGQPVPALRQVSVSIQRGEWVSIVGPSGSGKSTLLNLLAGLDKPDAGRVMIGGEDLALLSRAERARIRRTKIGIVLQSLNLVSDLTASQNIELPLRLAGVRPRSARSIATDRLAELGLETLRHRFPHEMSGGQQQRIAIVRALANQPTVLLADEPTGALDSGSANEVLGLLRNAHRGGQTLIVVTHDARVAACADRTITLEDGCVVAT